MCFSSIHAVGNSLRVISLAFSIFSIKIPYPAVGSLIITWVMAPTSLPFYDNQETPSRQACLSASKRRLLRERSENGAKHEVQPRSGEARKEYGGARQVCGQVGTTDFYNKKVLLIFILLIVLTDFYSAAQPHKCQSVSYHRRVI